MIRYSRAMTCLMTYYDKKRTEAISIMLQASSHAYSMRKRNVLDDNEWIGWLHIFRRGTIKQWWKQLEPDKCFNPDFQNFLYTEVLVGK